MTTLSELIKTINNESVMTDKAKESFRALLSTMSNMQATVGYVASIAAASQTFSWLGAFNKNPPGRQLFSEHKRFAEPANMD